MRDRHFKKFGKAKFVLIPIIALSCLALVSYLVMQLWNCILPEVIHVEPITFWQAAGIFILSKILFGFGKMGGFRRDKMFRHRLAERVKEMSPEELARFNQRFGDQRFGRFSNWCREDGDRGERGERGERGGRGERREQGEHKEQEEN